MVSRYRHPQMTMKKITKNTKKIVAMMLAVVMLVMNTIPMFAAEVETEVVSTETTETVESTEVVEPEIVETTEVVETTESSETEGMSLEDMLAEEDKTDETDEVVETFATLNLDIPASVVMSRDGIALLSMETSVMLPDGVVTLSQPVADEYYNRLESDVTITVVDGAITVEFNGQVVNGTVTDVLGNTVSFDGQTLTIINSEKMEDVVEEETEEPQPEEDEDAPVEPEEQPATYNVNYYVDEVKAENLLNSEVVNSVVGATIDLAAIELNKFKPVDTDKFTYVDGVMVNYCETVTADDSDIINIVYKSEVVVVYGDYTVNYFINEVAEENLLHRDVISAELGTTIDVVAINTNLYKPENTETTQWFDGVMVDSATVVTEDDSDVINIVYTSEEIIPELPEVAEATYTVKYYADALQPINYLGEIQVAGNVDELINFDTVNLNAYLPVGYGDGQVQTVVSATVVTEDDSDIVYVLYTKVEVIHETVTETITLPGETEYVYITETIIKEIEVEKIVEKIEYITEYVTEYIEVPVEVIVTEIVEKIVTEYEYIEVPYEVIVEIIKEIEKEVIVEVPGETIIEEVVVEKEVPVYITEYIEVPGEKEIVEKIVYVEVDEDEDDPVEPEENPDPEFDEDSPINPEDNPQTGDETSILFFVIMAMVSVFGMCYATKKEKVAR